MKRLIIVTMLLILISFPDSLLADSKVLIFAASSLTNAINEIATKFSALNSIETSVSFGASSTLAKQIENGAPVNVFISADQVWMDHLQAKGLVNEVNRMQLVKNRLVLIAPLTSSAEIQIKMNLPLGEVLGGGRLATGDPDHVPVGRYARSLEYLGVWSSIENRLARADNVRAALALVERGEAPLGIVYASDISSSNKVKILGFFPDESHSPIVYPAAMISGHDNEITRLFFRFLKGQEAKSIFIKLGFEVAQ